MFDALLLSGIGISLLAGQFARIELISALANVYMHEFLMLIFICRSIMQFGLLPIRNVFKLRTIYIFFSILFVSFFLSFTTFTVQQNSIAFLYLARVFLYLFFGIYLFIQLKKKIYLRAFLSKLIFIFSIILLILTAVQYVFFPNFWGLYALGWDPHLYRASSTYLDIFISAALYGLFALFWYIKKRRVLAALFCIALVLSFSRSAYIAFALSTLYFFIVQKKWKELLITLSLFIIMVIFVPKPFGEGGNLLRTSSINSRILDYKRGLTLWQKKPLFGYGYNRIRYAKEQLNLVSADDRSHSLSSFHSSYLMILVSTGIVGFISFMTLIIFLLKKYPQMRIYLIYILIMSLFDNVLLHVLVVLPLIFIAGNLFYSSLE